MISQNEGYVIILDAIFDNIFELNFKNGTLKNLKATANVLCCTAKKDIRLVMEDALALWVENEIHPEDRDAVRQLFADAADENAVNRSLRLQFRIISCCCGDSRSEWYFGEIIRLSEELCWFGFNRIEDQKAVGILKQEFEIKKKNIEYASKRQLVCARAGIVVIDYDFSLNLAWYAKGFDKYAFSRIGKDEGDISKEKILACIHPEDRDKYNDLLEDIVQGNSEYLSLIARIEMSDGSWHYTRTGACMLYDEAGKLERVIMSFTDVDKTIREQVGLRHTVELLNGLVNNNGLAVFTYKIENGKRVFTFVNSLACRFFGLSAKEFLTQLSHVESVHRVVENRLCLTDEQLTQLAKDGYACFDFADDENGNISYAFRCKEEGGTYYVTAFEHNKFFSPALSFPDPEEQPRKNVTIEAFGYFDIFVNGAPVLFKNDKAKELLALLVDRRGGYITPSEAISCLWEDEPVNDRTMARYRKTAFYLRSTLQENGISDIIDNVGGRRRILPEKVSCDFFDYLADKTANANLFKGVYMYNYSWGEVTLSSLLDVF